MTPHIQQRGAKFIVQVEEVCVQKVSTIVPALEPGVHLQLEEAPPHFELLEEVNASYTREFLILPDPLIQGSEFCGQQEREMNIQSTAFLAP